MLYFAGGQHPPVLKVGGGSCPPCSAAPACLGVNNNSDNAQSYTAINSQRSFQFYEAIILYASYNFNEVKQMSFCDFCFYILTVWDITADLLPICSEFFRDESFMDGC